MADSKWEKWTYYIDCELKEAPASQQCEVITKTEAKAKQKFFLTHTVNLIQTNDPLLNLSVDS